MIKLTIECIEANSNIPECMREEIPTDCEWREGYVFSHHIFMFYPSSNGGTLIEMSNNSSYLVKESMDTVKKLIEKTL
jgi:hypothetical protein